MGWSVSCEYEVIIGNKLEIRTLSSLTCGAVEFMVSVNLLYSNDSEMRTSSYLSEDIFDDFVVTICRHPKVGVCRASRSQRYDLISPHS